MLNAYLPKETTETWSGRKPEESNPDKYSKPEQLLRILERITEQKTVLLEAAHGEGKSTTMKALAKLMDINVIPYGTLSPKDISPAWGNIKKSTEKLDAWITNLKKHEENPDTTEGIILMDSADYLYTRYPFIKSYALLKEIPQNLITLEELELLQYYEKTIRLMETLAKAKK